MRIRLATEEDAKELLDIYRYYVEHTAITFEYETPSLEEFQKRIRNTLKRYPYLAAEENGKILGYAYASPFKERAAYDWSVETTIYVNKDAKHQGIGKKLYLALEEVLRAQHVINVDACITDPEIEDEYVTKNSVQYHTHLGYHLVGKFYKSGYKFGRWYDMVWMEKYIGKHKNVPEPFIPFSMLSDKEFKSFQIQ